MRPIARAGGRARYNLKRFDVAFQLKAYRCAAAAAQKKAHPARRSRRISAKQLGVNKTTVCRDVAQQTEQELRPTDPDVCADTARNEASWVLMLTNVDILLFSTGLLHTYSSSKFKRLRT